jgi:hypothetical protein
VSSMRCHAAMEEAVFYVMTSPIIETAFSMGSVQSAYKKSELTSQLSSGQLRVSRKTSLKAFQWLKC